MAIADFAPAERSAHSPLARGFHAVGRWFAARRVARARSDALHSLLFAPEHRLRDIGITHEQLIQAIAEQREQRHRADGVLLLR